VNLAISNIPTNTHLMASHQKITIRPFFPPVVTSSEENGDRFHPVVCGKDSIQLSERALELYTEAQAKVEELSKDDGLIVPKGANVEIVPLGTGSAVPTKYRNGKVYVPLAIDCLADYYAFSVSSTLIRIPGYGNILLDAGEGTWGQLARQFGSESREGEENVYDILRNTRCIYVSHIHADHHMGVAKILAERRKVRFVPQN
jgi:ribonuclease Z